MMHERLYKMMKKEYCDVSGGGGVDGGVSVSSNYNNVGAKNDGQNVKC